MPAIVAPGYAARPLYDHLKLRAWREAAGLSREEACVRIGCSCSWLTALELGVARRMPSLAMLTRLAEVYGHEPGELLTGSRSGGAR